jgi:NADPH2:quinone reductase
LKDGAKLASGARDIVEINPRDLISRDASIIGMSIINTPSEKKILIHEALHNGLVNGILNPIIGDKFPLIDVSKAHYLIMQSGAKGKIILLPESK